MSDGLLFSMFPSFELPETPGEREGSSPSREAARVEENLVSSYCKSLLLCLC